MNYAALVSEKNTPQTEPLNDRQAANNGGGFSFVVDKWKRLERFLILGSDRPTYYQSAQKLTRENATVVVQCWAEDAERTARTIMSVSVNGWAPKNDPAIFALVLGALSDNEKARQWALMPMTVGTVCRTGTHILQFVALAKEMGKGFGRGMKRAVAAWYTDKAQDKLAYQLVKYRSRHGLTHGNLVDMAHPKFGDNTLINWAIGKEISDETMLPPIIQAHIRAMKLDSSQTSDLLWIIADNPNLPWEALPTWANADAQIQAALLLNMGMTAMVRNLGNLTRIGAITPMSEQEMIVVNRLKSDIEVRASKIHPLQLLVAMKIYASGRAAMRGRVGVGTDIPTWSPNRNIVAALETAFYHSFGNVKKTGKRHFIAIDVSGSMDNPISSNEHVSCAEAAAALSMAIARSEDQTYVTRFNNGLEPVAFTKNSEMGEVLLQTRRVNVGGTDCALPMIAAMQSKIQADVFVIITDNETNSRSMHPMVALREYRKAMKIDAKLVVIGMTSTGFSIADPTDGGCLDVVGFDASAPAVIADFVR